MNEFHQLYIKYRSEINRYLFYLCGNQFIAEELAQETFLQAFKSIHRFKGHSKVSTWLYQIAKYTFYQYLRENDLQKLDIETESIQHDLSNKDTPDKVLEKETEMIHLLKAIRKLKQLQQDVIILRTYNELSFGEIGEIFNMSDNWARVNFYRAKNKLLTIINDGGARNE